MATYRDPEGYLKFKKNHRVIWVRQECSTIVAERSCMELCAEFVDKHGQFFKQGYLVIEDNKGRRVNAQALDTL